MHTNFDTIARLAIYPIFMKRMQPFMEQRGWHIYDVLSYAAKKTRKRLYTVTAVEMNQIGQTSVQPLYTAQIPGFLKLDDHGFYQWYCAETLAGDAFKGYADFNPLLGHTTFLLHECLRSFCDEQPDYLKAWFRVEG